MINLETNDRISLLNSINILNESQKFDYVGPNYYFSLHNFGGEFTLFQIMIKIMLI